MPKLLIVHINPDPDAITSIWLMRRFYPELAHAGVAFVPAGTTYQKQPVDSDPDIIHLDTGMGRFDHHQTGERTCAAKKVLEFLQEKFDYLRLDQALNRLVEVVLGDDHFDECYWPEPTADRYAFMFGEILDGLKHNNMVADPGLVDLGCTCLDGIYSRLKSKLAAEKDISAGTSFDSKWGKGLAVETKNDDVLALAQMMGYIMVIRKDPEGMMRIKAQPRSLVDFSEAFEKLKLLDNRATWFLHASKKMLLNGSYKNPDSVFTRLTIPEVIPAFQ